MGSPRAVDVWLLFRRRSCPVFPGKNWKNNSRSQTMIFPKIRCFIFSKRTVPATPVSPSTEHPPTPGNYRSEMLEMISKEKNEDMEEEPRVQETVVPEFDEKGQKCYEDILKFMDPGQLQKLKVDQCKIQVDQCKIKVDQCNEDMEEEPRVQETVVPEFDKKGPKCYEDILKFIEAGQVQKLKVDQCKIYLRKHGLRLTGTKDILIKRIEEHLEFLNGGGEIKYPPSSFVINCKGDACTGDVVLFEQNVYEMFSIASRCANGPPCGTRVIAGRVVKESYGAAKQQHTFTIEVLWSKGERPLPPLHPLLIKGRNLYRFSTMRQKWEDEGQRRKILIEKHARGGLARSKKHTRVQQRGLRKLQKSNRVTKKTGQCRHGKKTRKQKPNPISITSKNMKNKQQHFSRAQCSKERPTASLKINMPLDGLHVQRQPQTGMHSNLLTVPSGTVTHSMSTGSVQKNQCHGNTSFNPASNAGQVLAPVLIKNLSMAEDCPRPDKSKILCRFYAKGMCYYGEKCRPFQALLPYMLNKDAPILPVGWSNKFDKPSSPKKIGSDLL
ncbi:hypothetical protein M9H77_15219 [Catharanthus roseus]|uniref:Uncharacterized protein n=1 Tax=Catharanthus roseus TaxID=4058 RepID=A0ACC0AX72_CATRO|nr:hypothetical protein M9H77_15219 [Catharanthus roseus]